MRELKVFVVYKVRREVGTYIVDGEKLSMVG